jgi:diguanylate cyclase (GGDEF)-like protein
MVTPRPSTLHVLGIGQHPNSDADHFSQNWVDLQTRKNNDRIRFTWEECPSLGDAVYRQNFDAVYRQNFTVPQAVVIRCGSLNEPSVPQDTCETLDTIQLLDRTYSSPAIIVVSDDDSRVTVPAGVDREKLLQLGVQDVVAPCVVRQPTFGPIVQRAVLRQNSVLQWKTRALRDPLTTLPNRTGLLEHFSIVQSHMERNTDWFTLIVFIDLNSFGAINKTFGHTVGDTVLIQCAERLKSSLRGSDFACRYGGDEFLIVTEGFSGNIDAKSFLDRIRSCFRRPFAGDLAIPLTATIGGIEGNHRSDLTSLIRQADDVMRHQKNATPSADPDVPPFRTGT